MGKSEHETGGHIFEPYPLQIARVIINVRITQSYRRGVTLVIDDGIWHINTFPTGELGSKTQVDVFIVKKEVRVQKADVIDRLPAIQSSCGTSGKNRLQRAITSAIVPMAAIETYAGGCQAIPCAIDATRTFDNEF